MKRKTLDVLFYTESKQTSRIEKVLSNICESKGCIYSFTKITPSELSQQKESEYDFLIIDAGNNSTNAVKKLKKLFNMPVLCILDKSDTIDQDKEIDHMYVDEITPSTIDTIVRVMYEKYHLTQAIEKIQDIENGRTPVNITNKQDLVDIKNKYMPLLAKLRSEIRA